TGFESRDDAKHVGRSNCCPSGWKRHRCPEVLLLLIKGEASGGLWGNRIDAGRHHANDGITCAIERNTPVDDVSIAAEASLPKRIAKDNDLSLFRLIFFRRKRT